MNREWVGLGDSWLREQAARKKEEELKWRRVRDLVVELRAGTAPLYAEAANTIEWLYSSLEDS